MQKWSQIHCASFQPTFSYVLVMGVETTKIIKKVGRFFKPHYIKAKFSKNPPNQDLETQHVVSFKNLLLSQSKIALSNSYATMIEEFHQLN